MPEDIHCGECGAPLPAYWPKGLCAHCALDGVLDLPEADTPIRSGDEPPSAAENQPSTAGPPPNVTGGRFGDYELLEEIARGGMGVVYRARQISLNRTVALKMILSGQFASKQEVLRFRAEAEAAANLHHPNIVAIHETGEAEGRHYFSMEYVRGRNLAEIAAEGPLPAKRTARYAKIVAEAIHYAHEQGVLHRDLKPSNILIDENDHPRITDFGLAKRARGDFGLTVTGQLLGSPNFMPPEQTSGKSGKVGPASDVYGLGAIVYHLLTGRPPFQAETIEDVLRQLHEADPVAPRLLNPSIPRDLETICLRCLEKDPAKRYQSAQALADELGCFLREEPIQARPVSAPEKIWRWCRRKPVLAALIVLVHVVGAAGLAGILWQWQRAERNATAERHQRERAETGEGNARRLLYAADINLAQQSLKLNNLGKARRLLDRHRPQPGEEDLRGWEWRYLWQLTGSSARVTLTNRPVRGFSVSFSPDGTRLAVGWDDGHVDLWDVPGRRLVRALTDREYPHEGRVAFSPVRNLLAASVVTVAFSPVRNLLAASSEPKVVTLYDLDSGRESILWQAPDQGAWNVRDLAFSQDGSRVVIYAGIPYQIAGSTREISDEVWVVNVSSSQIEGRHPTVYSGTRFHGAARLSPDNRSLYLARSDWVNSRYSIRCIDLATSQQRWQTEPQRDKGLTALAISPDGQVLASGSGFGDPTIRVWDAATGLPLRRLEGHTGFVFKLAFAKDGRRLISAAADQTIRFWDTNNWTETKVLRGHTDEVHSVAISDTAQLVASAGKDGNLMLWKADDKSTTDGYSRLPEKLGSNEVLPLDHSRVLLLPPGQPPELVDLKGDSAPVTLLAIGSSTNVLGCFGTNILCHWNGTNQILVRELRGAEFIQRGAISLDSGTRPTGFAYNAMHQLLAWTEETSSNSVYVAGLAAPGRRIELKSNAPGLLPFRFSEDGNYLAAKGQDILRAWNVETGQIVAFINEPFEDAAFAADGRVLVVAIRQGNDHEIRFYDLVHRDRAPRRFPGRHFSVSLAASPDGGLVASATHGGQVRLFAAAKGEFKKLESLHGHIGPVRGITFSADGRRLISASGGREVIKLWDVGTRQELLTLGGTDSGLVPARWSADGDVILAGPPWQAWRAPSWEEIAAAEAKEPSRLQNSAAQTEAAESATGAERSR